MASTMRAAGFPIPPSDIDELHEAYKTDVDDLIAYLVGALRAELQGGGPAGALRSLRAMIKRRVRKGRVFDSRPAKSASIYYHGRRPVAETSVIPKTPQPSVVPKPAPHTEVSKFRGNVRLSVQQKCHSVKPRWYQMMTFRKPRGIVALADPQRPCIS